MVPSSGAPANPFSARIHGPAFWLACTALLLVLHSTNQLSSDEGVILNGAWNLFNGLSLYTDFFEYIAPGSFYLVFAAWKLLGAHFWVAKLLGILAILGAALGVYRIGQLLVSYEQATTPQWTLWLGPAAYCLMSGYWPAINHNTFNIAFVVWGAYFVTKSFFRRSLSDAIVGGLLSGVSVLFLQHRGLVLPATALLAFGLAHGRSKDVAWLRNGAGLVVGTLVPIAVLLLYWPASVLVEHLISFPATRYLAVNRVDLSLFLLTACALALAAWLLRGSSVRAVWFLGALQGALLLTSLQRPDLAHITLTLFPVLALLPLILPATRTCAVPAFFVSALAGAGLMLVFPLVFHLVLTYPAWFVDKSATSAPIQYVKQNCESSRYIYAGPFVPGFYFETRKLNPTRYSVLLPNFNTREQFLDAQRDIQAQRPQCVIANYATVEKFGYSKENVVDSYIASNYRLVSQPGRVQVFVAPAAPVN